mgnify:CR=1 FL=1
MIRKTLRNATAAILIRQECKAAGLKGIPVGAFWETAKWLFQQLAFNPKYEDPESQEGQRAAVLALADEAVASVRNYRSETPEQPFVEAWLRRDTDDFRFQVMAILHRRKVKSPWARRE